MEADREVLGLLENHRGRFHHAAAENGGGLCVGCQVMGVCVEKGVSSMGERVKEQGRIRSLPKGGSGECAVWPGTILSGGRAS